MKYFAIFFSLISTFSFSQRKSTENEWLYISITPNENRLSKGYSFGENSANFKGYTVKEILINLVPNATLNNNPLLLKRYDVSIVSKKEKLTSHQVEIALGICKKLGIKSKKKKTKTNINNLIIADASLLKNKSLLISNTEDGVIYKQNGNELIFYQVTILQVSEILSQKSKSNYKYQGYDKSKYNLQIDLTNIANSFLKYGILLEDSKILQESIEVY